MKRYESPNGTAIIGILETVICRADINGISADGSAVEYAGNTEVFWDEQKPVSRNGSFVFLDTDGAEWAFDQIKEVHDDNENGQ